MTKTEKERFRLKRRVFRKRRARRKLVLIAIVFEDKLTGREVSFPVH
jgi:hypothetical protein